MEKVYLFVLGIQQMHSPENPKQFSKDEINKNKQQQSKTVLRKKLA